MITLNRFLGLFCLHGIIITMPSIAMSQDTLFIFTFPSAKEIDISVLSSVQPVTGKYRYEYEINSLPSSDQMVYQFSLVHQASVESLTAPSGWDVSIEFGPWPYVSWGFSDTTYGIIPGGSMSGYNLVSEGLPTIGDFFAQGWVPVPILEAEPDSIVGGEFPDDNLQGKTLVPRTPPTPFHALTFLDTITSYISQSRTLGWITNDPTANKYKRLIDTARFHLQANNRGVTKAKLDSVLVNVYPDSAAGLITSEAYALLRFNTEYLLKKLSEE